MIGEFQPLNNECLIFIIFLVIDDISVVSICIGFFFFFFFINLFISNKPINLGLCGSTGLLRLYTPICLYSQKRKLPWVYLKSSLHPTPPGGRAGSLSLQKKLSWLCHNPFLKKLIDAELITPRRHFFLIEFH